MDVRFLVDDLDLDLVDEERLYLMLNTVLKQGATSPEDPLESKDAGGVQVELDTVTPPGAMASGSVTFSMTAKKWTLDQFGRLGLSGGDEGYKPSDEDVMEFQKQLDATARKRILNSYSSFNILKFESYFFQLLNFFIPLNNLGDAILLNASLNTIFSISNLIS